MSAEEQAALASELRALVEAELQRTGHKGALRVEGEELVLARSGRETRAELRGTLTQWEHLPDDLRERRVQQIAGLLAAAEPPGIAAAPTHRAPAPKSTRPKEGLSWTTIFAPLAIIAVTGGAIALAYRFLAPASGLTGFPSTSSSARAGASGAPASSAAADSDHERFLFASAACEHTRTRIAQGGSIGPADTEGWVVELVLFRRGAAVDLTNAPELDKFIARRAGSPTGTVSWAPAKELMGAQRFDAEVTLSALSPLGAAKDSGLDLVFSGPYVTPYFTETQRGDYFRLADALADDLKATEGALFARCAHAEAHQIGAWFLGSTPGAALGSLVYFMGSYAPAQRDHAFDSINEAAAKADRNATATLIGRELGMISGGKDRPARITFPFRDANRATRASLLATRALKLENP